MTKDYSSRYHDMEKAKLKKLRNEFRDSVFKRDKNKCVYCCLPAVDAHHITDRNEMPNGGYATENGVSLCSEHHAMAEVYHQSSGAYWIVGFNPNELYKKIGSSYDKAYSACESLNEK